MSGLKLLIFMIYRLGQIITTFLVEIVSTWHFNNLTVARMVDIYQNDTT